MKTLNADRYNYLGIKDNWHVFESCNPRFDPELLYVYRARYVLPDGRSIFFDPITEGSRGLTVQGLLMLSEYENSRVCTARQMSLA